MSFTPIWESILDNLKMHRLPVETVGKWTWMLACARRHDRENGALPDLETLAFWLRHPEEEVKEWLDELVAAKLIDRQGRSYSIHDWSEWQYSSDPKAKERMRRWRERQKTQENGEPERNVTAPVTRNVTARVTERYDDVTRKLRCNHKNKQTNNVVDDDVVLERRSSENDEVVFGHSNDDDDVVSFGRSTMGDRFDLEAIGEKLAGWRALKYMDTWIRDAIVIANCNAKPGKVAAYMTTCLRRWFAKGGPDPAELVKAQAKTASMPRAGGTNGSLVPYKPTPPVPDPAPTEAELRETLAGLEGLRRLLPWQRDLLEQTREELAKL